MSGGHFDYKQHDIDDIIGGKTNKGPGNCADCIEKDTFIELGFKKNQCQWAGVHMVCPQADKYWEGRE